MDAAEALADLKQISTQIERAVILGADGTVEASTLADAGAAAAMAAAGRELWSAAERARHDLGRPRLSQLEVATPEGSVFAVADEERTIVAVTTVDPTVGLVFYDLKSCLRSLAEEPVEDEVAAADEAPTAGGALVAGAEAAAPAAPVGVGAAAVEEVAEEPAVEEPAAEDVAAADVAAAEAVPGGEPAREEERDGEA